jgi:glycosyltransferase involved in cell wall biosynthesis
MPSELSVTIIVPTLKEEKFIQEVISSLIRRAKAWIMS